MVFMIITVIAVLSTIASAAPVDEVQLTKSVDEKSPDGSYNFEFEQSDGQKRSEQGFLNQVSDNEEPVLSVSGSYSFIGPDGKEYTVTYTADENGFRAYGDHIPKANGNDEEPMVVNIVPFLSPLAIRSLVG